MIELVITGGLGNQLFQYACARRIQLRDNSKLVINTNLYKYDKYGRSFSLDAFAIPKEEVVIVNRPARWVKLIGGLSNISKEMSFNIFRFFGLYIWKGRDYKEIKCSKRRNVLYGYFQSEKYFCDIKEIIKKELIVTVPIPQENMIEINKIKSMNAVCLHIRRTDYVEENAGTCSMTYYKKAVEYVKARVPEAEFYVFTDDNNWAKKFFPPETYHYIENINRDYYVLQLMYNCKHFIMSNSSFSWWAQFLSDNDKKIVIAPQKWVRDGSLQDIYQNDWIIL